MSIPRAIGQIPVYYNHKSAGRPSPGPGDEGSVFWSHFNDEENTPQYPFGYGISYTTFEYSAPELSGSTMGMNETVEVSVDVTNTGDFDGEEVVQFYIRDRFASTMRPVQELKGFEKVMIKKGETKTITFTIDKETLSFYTHKGEWVAEPGMFSIMIGGSSDNVQMVELELLD